MAINLLESDRIDRYEFEVFISQIDFTEHDTNKDEVCRYVVYILLILFSV